MKKLIISCDDLGISEEINLGIKDCFDNGVATSSSIVVNGEFYNHALNEVITNLPTKFYGLHLNLTEGKALSENCVNKICDKNNMFNISAKKYFLLNFVKSDKSLEKIIYEELKLQIEKALEDGIKISHFDSHEHIHHSPWIFNIISTLGKEFNINKIRFVNEKIVIKNYFNGAYNKLRNLNYLKHLGFGLELKKCAATGLNENLLYVSPKSGRAISEDAAGKWINKLLVLPQFLLNQEKNNDISKTDIINGLNLSGHFLNKYAELVGSDLPYSRKIFINKINKINVC